ncbi:MAG: hypothetical protein ACOC33_01190 [bacterium]
MDFFIGQNSNFPKIRIRIDHSLKEYGITGDMIENAVATFSMINSETGIYQIANKGAEITVEERLFNDDDPYIYYLEYKFDLEDTEESGKFIGEFKIDFIENDIGCSKLTFPNDEILQIIIRDSITKTSVTNI